ncbi:MAG: hypothetical protein HZC41_17875 [Chloroflexi bacterium]|nr:hypothetical protein [Chloroflexota bacterium]
MNDQTQQALAEAFELIEADKLDEARGILKPMLTTHRDNPDVWWLYAHAVTEPEEARTALNQVLRLDPNYPDAAQLLDRLESQAAPRRAGVTVVETEPRYLADIPPTLPDLPEPEDEELADIVDLDAERKIEAEEPSRTRLLLLGALGLIALAVIVAIAVLTSQPRRATPTPTSEGIAAEPSNTPLAALPEITEAATSEVFTTVEATEAGTEVVVITAETADVLTEVVGPTAVVEATDAVVEPSATPTRPRPTVRPTEAASATPEPSATPTQAATPTAEANTAALATARPTTAVQSAGGPLDAYIQALIPYGIAPSGVGVEQTTQGNTVIANICAAPGPEVRSKLPEVMDAIARQPVGMPVDAVGARMVNCADNSALLLIVVPFSDAQAYASGSLSEEDFQARWKSL